MTKIKKKNAKPLRSIDDAWFRRALEDAGITSRKLANILDVDPSGISRLLAGNRNLQIDEAAIIAKHINRPFMEVCKKAGIPLDKISPEESGNVRISALIDTDGLVLPTPPKNTPFVTAPSDVPTDTVAARCDATAQDVQMYDGWVLFYAPLAYASPDAVGRLCVVRVEGQDSDRACFVHRGYEPGRYTLISPKGEEMKSVKLITASPVSWIRLP